MKMAAPNSHFVTAFKNSCIVRPRHPETRLPITTEEAMVENGISTKHAALQQQESLAQRIQEQDLDEELERNRSDWNEIDVILDHSPKSDNTGSSSRNFDHDLSNLLQNDSKFYKHLQSLRRENKKTIKMLERFYHTKPKSQENVDPKRQDFVTKMKKEAHSDQNHLFVNKVYNSITNSNEDESELDGVAKEDIDGNGYIEFVEPSGPYGDLSSTESEEDPRKQWSRQYSRNILPDDSEEDFRGREFSYEVIDNMWDNFSVDSYAPVEKGSKEDTPKQNKWTPSITIPEPFQMTLREAAKAKIRSKRKEKLDQELLKKKLVEEAELNKKFRARPLPASTFVKRYAEREAIEEQKREYRRSLNKAILEATQKPFNFMKREEKKHELRRSQSLERMDRDLSAKENFKATPFPDKLFNLSLEDRLAEQEEYRKIKTKMRAQEMLANSTLPPNMRARGERYTINKRYEKQRAKESKPPKSNNFRPHVNHEIPDYEEMHRKFEEELIRKRQEKSSTICKPFDLHTAKVPTRRSRRVEGDDSDPDRGRHRTSVRPKEGNFHRSRSSSVDLRRNFNGSLSDEAPVFAMTETARLRHSMKKETMEKQARREEAARQKAERQKRRENQLRKEVAKKSISNDMKHVMERQNKETLQRFRESEIERKKAYKQYLKEIKTKLDRRPLLFEQESQTNAKRLAQRKYKEILKEAGVEDDVLESLVNSDGKIIDAESDDDTDELLADQYEADQSTMPHSQGKADDTFDLDESDDESGTEPVAAETE